jgi:hypothetical protein
VQRWRCGSCRRFFTPAPPALRNKTYPLSLILDAVTLYNLGHTLAETSAALKTRRGVRVPTSTISAWIAEHRDLTTFARLRDEGRLLFTPRQTIRTTKLYHRQVYEFAYHQPKLALLRQSREHARFAPIADFLEAVPKICPHDLFAESARASQSAAPFINPATRIAIEKQNFATRAASLVIPAVGDNYKRHETLQRFMLANDSVSLAVEVPIWLTAVLPHPGMLPTRQVLPHEDVPVASERRPRCRIHRRRLAGRSGAEHHRVRPFMPPELQPAL